MNHSKTRLAEANRTYRFYWESYLGGDLEAFASTLDETFEMIGTSEGEVCHSKAEGIAFYKAQMHEVVGKVEMRNRQNTSVWLDPLVLINEACDIYFKTDEGWNFYSKLRLSTLLRETNEGWKVVQQHGSLPDMRVGDGETMAIEKISKENLELRDAVKRRTAELENKNRELAIEAALEKVRAVAMGMKKPEDMLDVCRAISDQLQQFGVEKIRNVQIAIIDENIGQYLCYQYFTPYDKTALEKTEYFKSPVEHGMVRQMLASRDGYFIGKLSGGELEDFRSHRKEENHFPDPLLDEATALDYCFLSIGEGGLGLTVYQQMNEEVLTLFKRFHQVFSLAYQRFRDIQKAEAQAREAQIEVALERTRTQSMLMRHSDEIKSISNAFHEQLIQLGIPSEFSYVWLPDEPKGEHQFWASWSEDKAGKETVHSKQVTYPLDKSEPYTAACFAAWANPEVILEEFISPSEIHGFFEVWQELLAGAEKLKAEYFPEGIYYSEAYMRYGCFGINIRRLLSEEEKHILKRFSIEFERAYTRFLDLQKAEAQAREAQIEAALERVRSRSMAMHKSEELKDVIQIVYEQIVHLNITTEHAGFIMDYKRRDDFDSWIADQFGSPSQLTIPYFDCIYYNRFNEAKAKGEDFFATILSFEEKNRFYEALFQHIPDFPEESKNIIFSHPGFTISTVLLENVALYIENFSGIPFSEEENAILMRFGKVFQQTYIRFLDLQKAEAQAKEAQIEVALERVRASAMAMQRSDEMAAVSQVLDQQVRALGIETWGSAFHIYADSAEGDYEWFSSANGSLPFYKTPREQFFLEFYQKGREGELLYVKEFEGDSCIAHYEFLKSVPIVGDSLRAMEASGIPLPVYQIDHIAFFQHGYILFITYKPVPEAYEIFKRFAKVFEQAYTRFLDLQKAEAQAREAQIEAALEKVRSRSLAMHKSDELGDVVITLLQRFTELDIKPDGININIINKESKYLDTWFAAPGYAKAICIPTPYFNHPVINDAWEAFEDKKELYHITYSKEVKDSYFTYLHTHTPFKQIPEERKQMIMAAEVYNLSVALTNDAAISVHNYSHQALSEIEHEILKRFSKVFQQSYTRFLDLQKAEAQAREARIEAALEKVRSRTMAMQSSEELADAAYVLFEQLRLLGVTHERINIGIVNEDSQTIDFWITEQGGDKLNTKFSGRISEPTTLSKAYAAWKNGEKSLMVDLQGEELKSWLSYLSDEIKIPFNKAFLHDRRVQTAGFFSKGMLILTSPEPLQQEALYLLEKFAGVFDLTYTRFSDLKLAEAQALQAEKDLIEIKIARQKAEEALTDLKSTQAQLIQQEKLASLGQLTAGIAHEIKNPLNFVNNFSEVSMEMIEEILEARSERRALRLSSGTEARSERQESRDKNQEAERDESEELEDEILEDIKANLEKIHEHGSRANGIVTSMLQHSRGGSGKKEPTDLNALIKEYVNLSFHGMRAGKNPIDVEIELDLDREIKEIPLVREDFTRVIINLCNNAFDAMRQKFNSELLIVNSELYHPKLTVHTKSEKDHILISVEDNGPGIPDEIKDKILQPFFTTKKGTEGTGLGLSITHDIVKAHGGKLSLESILGNDPNSGKTGAIFIISLPLA